jgi:membrane protease YdiL (CAAX protease family)
LLGGIAGGAILWLFRRYSPKPFAPLQSKFSLVLLARVLYGGITEELFVRWGLMTVLVWFLWRFWQGMVNQPSIGLVWVAIVTSALIFGFSHLPAASALIAHLSVPLAAYIVIANATFGLIAGYLYWCYGLESAILAHASAHLVAFVLWR